jgi:hypothetical protein
MSSAITTVYVLLPDEVVEVWRPVHAVRSGDAFRLLASTPDGAQDGERWEFPPGSLVRCETRPLSEGPALVAVRRG